MNQQPTTGELLEVIIDFRDAMGSMEKRLDDRIGSVENQLSERMARMEDRLTVRIDGLESEVHVGFRETHKRIDGLEPPRRRGTR